MRKGILSLLIDTDLMTQPTLEPASSTGSVGSMGAMGLISSRLSTLSLPSLFSSLTAGVVIGTIGVIRAISYATLIFAWPLSDQIPIGIGMAVLSTGVIGVMVALLSAYPGMIATPLAAPTVLLAGLAHSIAESLQAQQASAETILITVLAAIALVSLLTGVVFLILGVTQLGERIRVIPYPVVGGFMAGTGWLLVEGFIQITTGLRLRWETLADLIQTDHLVQWLPGVGFALILLVASRAIQHFLVIPIVLLISTAIFYLILGITHTDFAEARSAGLLLQLFPGGNGELWHPLTLESLTKVQWEILGDQTGSMIAVAVVTLLSLFLSNNGIELAVGRDINLNQQLVAIGFANIGSGLLSGMVGTQALPSTMLAEDMQASNRLTGVFTAIPVVAVLSVGTSFLGYLPQAVLGSLILYLGISLFRQWLVESWSQLPLASYLIIVVILVATAKFGLLQGVALGFLLSIFHFVYAYSHLAVVKSARSGHSTRSNAGRSAQQYRYLADQGDRIHLMELQGFIFFGTAPLILKQVCDRALKSPSKDSDRLKPDLDYLILDFNQVVGLDSSAVTMVSKILKLAQKQHFQVLFTNLSDPFQDRLTRSKAIDLGKACHVFPDVDRALEWAENQLLQHSECDDLRTLWGESVSSSLPEAFREMLSDDQLDQFMIYLEPVHVPEAYTIFDREGSFPGLYFILSGQVSVLLDSDEGETKRLQTCTSGQILGEMRFFGKAPLSSRVITDTATDLLYLSPEKFTQMKQEAPDLTYALQEYIVKVLCDSLIRRKEQIQIMQ